MNVPAFTFLHPSESDFDSDLAEYMDNLPEDYSDTERKARKMEILLTRSDVLEQKLFV